MKEENKSDEWMKKNVKSFILIITLVGIVLVLLNFIMIDPDKKHVNNLFYNLIASLSLTLGQTLIGSSVISILFSFKDFREYSLGVVQRAMADFSFINILKEKRVEDIHEHCHKILHYNNVDLNTKEWDFLKNKCVEVFKIPCCKEWNEEIECSIKDNEIHKILNISYTLINPLKDKKSEADIMPLYYLLVPEGQNNEDYLKLKTFEVTVDEISIKFTPKIESEPVEKRPYDTLFTIQSEDLDLKKVSFKNKLDVKLVVITRVPINDLSYTKRLRYPTLDFRLGFTCLDNFVKMSPQFFGGFIKKDGFEIELGDNHSTVKCKDRLILPGGGASIFLNLDKEKFNVRSLKSGVVKRKTVTSKK